MQKLKIITTADGSHSIMNVDLDETYHSTHGALQESQHVFIKNGLDFFLARTNTSIIHILEIGFGTGLNALLVLQRARELADKIIYYTSIEPFPLQRDVWLQLNYAPTLQAQALFHDLHQAPWDCWSPVTQNFKLMKKETTLQRENLEPSTFDVVFFDAFAPGKQPDMWTIDVLQKTVNGLKPEGCLVTYCAKGQLKRDLKNLGLTVETLPGAPGKKEMVRGLKTSSST